METVITQDLYCIQTRLQLVCTIQKVQMDTFTEAFYHEASAFINFIYLYNNIYLLIQQNYFLQSDAERLLNSPDIITTRGHAVLLVLQTLLLNQQSGNSCQSI